MISWSNFCSSATLGRQFGYSPDEIARLRKAGVV